MVRLYSIKTLFNVVWTLCLLCCPTVSSGKDTIPTGLEGIEFGEVKYGEGDVAGALKIFMDVAHEADDRHDAALACLAYYNIGVTYFSLYSNVEAIQNFQKAYDLCLRNNLGSGRETEIIGGISGVFFQLGNYSKAKQMLSKALAVAQSNNDSVMISTFTADMALLCNKTGDFDSVPHWLDMSRRYLRSGKPTINLLEIAAETAMKQKNYTRAEQLCNEILSYPTDAGANRGLAYTY
ncbi:MAG: tetratricopeptide repeat protein, partial [Muribaculaceae bacterium]|nr:tetratricopeptide repeat protein [Muribaculaceae bacterium]